ncbi:MAG: glycosyltransferase family 2 protein [Planctomycetes bacterium]|nr:glycosyltransferase family 2 protein [Planctomycetota bacterium]
MSIIIPLYNKRPYICRALDSVLRQTYRNFEVVVVDDGSTDAGLELVQAYRDTRFRMVRQANAGPGAARNRGLAESGGPYVAFLDADDEWMPTYLERMMAVLEAHPQCGAAASTYFLGAQKVDITAQFRALGMVDGPWNLSLCRNRRELGSAVYAVNSSTTTARRDVVEEYGGFYQKDHCTLGEDYYLWVQMLLGHDVYRLLEPLAWYHIEASELGVGPKSRRLLEPVLTDPDPLRRRCPSERREVLEQWLAQFALATAHELAAFGDRERAAWLARTFPLMKARRWEYLKLQMKLAVPVLVPYLRRARNLLGVRRAS